MTLDTDKLLNPKVQAYFRAMRPKLYVGKPTITKDHLGLYAPPPTNAEVINPWTGAESPITSINALILFSSPADVAKYLPLLQAVDPNTQAFDGSGIVCPPVMYGSDGRKINCYQGTVNINGTSYTYQVAIGILIAAAQWGPMWNGMHQGPYTKLIADAIDPVDAQIDWTN